MINFYRVREAEMNGIIGVPIVGRQNVTDVNTGAETKLSYTSWTNLMSRFFGR
jgi:hypothetical protein